MIAKKSVTFKSYTPFGEQIEEQTSGFGFNGEYYDATTGQIYLRARFYDPEMARFGQKDIVRGTITDALSLNRYSYCENDPVNFVDPSGMRAVVDIDAASVASKPKTTTTSKAATKPVQSHTSSVNPNNTAKVTSQAVADAKAAMDFANRTAPNSLQAQQARDAYQRTVNNAAIANATNNPSAAMKAVQTSKQAVNYANSSVSATGKPKTSTTNTNPSSNGRNSSTPNTSSPTVQSPVQGSGNCNEKAYFVVDGISINALGASDYDGISQAIEDFSNLPGNFGTTTKHIVTKEQILSVTRAFGIITTQGKRSEFVTLQTKDDTKPVVLFHNIYFDNHEFGIAINNQKGRYELSFSFEDGLTFKTVLNEDKGETYTSVTFTLSDILIENGYTVSTEVGDITTYTKKQFQDDDPSGSFVSNGIIIPIGPGPIPVM